MSVYMIIEISVRNREPYARYIEAVPSIITKHGGKYLSRGGTITPMFGDWNPERIILLEFPDMASLMRCFKSAEYRKIAPLRECSTDAKSIVVEGIL